MTLEEAKKHLSAGRWITRPGLGESFLTHPSATPPQFRDIDLEWRSLADFEMHHVFWAGWPYEQDPEGEYLTAFPYSFSEQDKRAADWEIVPLADTSWSERVSLD